MTATIGNIHVLNYTLYISQLINQYKGVHYFMWYAGCVNLTDLTWLEFLHLVLLQAMTLLVRPVHNYPFCLIIY